MSEIIRFIPSSILTAKNNLAEFIQLVQTHLPPLLDRNCFENDAWSIEGLGQKGGAAKFVYFTRTGVSPRLHYPEQKRIKGEPAVIPKDLLLSPLFRQFAKAMISYLHGWEKTTSIPSRVAALRHLEDALFEQTGCTCPTAITPEVLNRACALAFSSLSSQTAYDRSVQLSLIYRYMVELGLVSVPSEWTSPHRQPQRARNRVGEKFDLERKRKMPSPLALEALATIFNSDSTDIREVFASSVCALLICAPDRSVEILFAPWDILAPEWADPDTGEIGATLRWFPAKGGPPMIKTVIPSMRDIAVRAVDKLRTLSAPARKLALWYEENPDQIYLPPSLEYLRGYEQLDLKEVYAILFGGEIKELTQSHRHRTLKWLKAKHVPRRSKRSGSGRGTTIAFADLERSVLSLLPSDFPVMDTKTGMRYSESLCLARIGEFDSQTSEPWQCCFDRIKHPILQAALQSQGTQKSVFELGDYRDTNGTFLKITTHMLRHYLNTLVRQSGLLTEEDIAKWSGRRNIRQNTVYNHQSDRDLITKLREAVGDSSHSVGPFANIDNKTFIRRDQFANIKIITAHTTEFGYCIHDYAQLPCQVHQDCINCDELVCIKGDARAEENLRKIQTELTQLQKDARVAFSEAVIGASEWFDHHSKTLERANQLIAILEQPIVPDGAVVQLSGVVPPSRLAQATEVRGLSINPINKDHAPFDDECFLLEDVSPKITEYHEEA